MDVLLQQIANGQPHFHHTVEAIAAEALDTGNRY